MATATALRPIYQFIRDTIPYDGSTIVYQDQSDLQDIARLIVSRVATTPAGDWPLGSLRMLELCAETAVSVLVADRACDPPQPNQPHVLLALAEEIRKPLKVELPVEDPNHHSLLQCYLGVLRYAYKTILTNDHVAGLKRRQDRAR